MPGNLDFNRPITRGSIFRQVLYLLGNICPVNHLLTRELIAMNVFRTYLPSKISSVVELWRESLMKISEKAGQSLAGPDQYENLFPNLADALKTEQYLLPERHKKLPAAAYPHVPVRE